MTGLPANCYTLLYFTFLLLFALRSEQLVWIWWWWWWWWWQRRWKWRLWAAWPLANYPIVPHAVAPCPYSRVHSVVVIACVIYMLPHVHYRNAEFAVTWCA